MKDSVVFRLSLILADLRTMQIQALHEAEDSEVMYELSKDLEALREKYEIELKELKDL